MPNNDFSFLGTNDGFFPQKDGRAFISEISNEIFSVRKQGRVIAHVSVLSVFTKKLFRTLVCHPYFCKKSKAVNIKSF